MEYVVPSLDLSGIQVLFVHALNPYGFSHLMRVNEDNVDLNRNFVHSFNEAKNINKPYLKFRNDVFPRNWHGSDLNDILDAVDRYVSRNGADDFQRRMTQGQYICPESPYFGGVAPTWSHRTWRKICETLRSKFETVVHIDIHSGLGPFGDCEIIYTGPMNTTALVTAKSWYGAESVILPGEVQSVTPSIEGPLSNGILKTHPQAICLAFEFGTIALLDMLKILIASTWLFHNPQCDEYVRKRILEQSRQAFCPDDPSWISCVWDTTRILFRKAIDGIQLH